MLNTGLSDTERESLLKYLLTCCSLEEQKINGDYSYIIHFNRDHFIPFDYAQLIKKAILNIQNNVIM